MVSFSYVGEIHINSIGWWSYQLVDGHISNLVSPSSNNKKLLTIPSLCFPVFMKAMFLARVAESKHMYSVALFRTVSLARTQDSGDKSN